MPLQIIELIGKKIASITEEYALLEMEMEELRAQEQKLLAQRKELKEEQSRWQAELQQLMEQLKPANEAKALQTESENRPPEMVKRTYRLDI